MLRKRKNSVRAFICHRTPPLVISLSKIALSVTTDTVQDYEIWYHHHPEIVAGMMSASIPWWWRYDMMCAPISWWWWYHISVFLQTAQFFLLAISDRHWFVKWTWKAQWQNALASIRHFLHGFWLSSWE